MRLLTGFWNSHYAARQGWRPAPRSTPGCPSVSHTHLRTARDGGAGRARGCGRAARPWRPRSPQPFKPGRAATVGRLCACAGARRRQRAHGAGMGGVGRAWPLAPSRFRAISASRPFPPGRRWPPFRGQLPGKGASRKGGAQFLPSLPSFPPSHCFTLWFGYTRPEDQGVSRRLCGGVFRSQKL